MHPLFALEGLRNIRGMKYNPKLAQYVNQNFSFVEEYKRIFGKVPPTGKMFCPFHDNKNTPAAKIYDNSLKCFGVCGRMFSVYDLLVKFDPELLTKVEAQNVLPGVVANQRKLITTKSINRTDSIENVINSILNGNTDV